MPKKFHGGYNIHMAGKPSAAVEALPEPDRLVIPLESRRLKFSQLDAGDGQRVRLGEAIAYDPANYNVPLLAPRAGTVKLNVLPGHVVIEDLSTKQQDTSAPEAEPRRKLVELGAWQFISDAHTGALPDPELAPAAAIVSTPRTEPFLAAADAQLGGRLHDFANGLELLHSLLGDRLLYVVIPQKQADGFDKDILDTISGHSFVRTVRIPPVYPFDHPALLARHLGLKRSNESPVWFMHVEGVLAVNRALALMKPCIERIISLGGPAVTNPMHLEAMPGYPVDAVFASRIESGENRVINGGCLTGESIGDTRVGIDVECTGLTVLPEHNERKLLSFMRPGSDRSSYSRCFLSAITGGITRRLTTAMNGELRACITCGLCEQVCPESLLPWLFHKLAYSGGIDEMERAGIDLCIECGLCSFVCPSKIDVREDIRTAKAEIAEESAEERK